MSRLLTLVRKKGPPVPSWAAERILTIDNAGGAAKTDHQVLATFTSANFDFTQAQSDGRDLRFYDGATECSYWIEAWDAVAQAGRVWVKVPSIPAAGTKELTMRHGNATVATASDPVGTARYGWGRDFKPNKARVMHAKIPADVQSGYGCRYPLTYMFAIPEGSSGLSAWKRGSEVGEWEQLEARAAGSWSGVEAVRFDYAAARAYVSASFYSDTTNLYLTVRRGSTDVGSFLGIAKYYDNRDAACVLTWDDWDGTFHSLFMEATAAHQARGLWMSPGVVPGGITAVGNAALTAGQWTDMQAAIDLGYVEPCSHTFNHIDAITEGYDEALATSEIDGCRTAILGNVTMPWQGRRGSTQYLPGHIRPYGRTNSFIRARLGATKFLGDRDTGISSAGLMPRWNANLGYYAINDLVGINVATYADLDSLATLNAAFDACLAAGTVYHMYGHPWNATVSFTDPAGKVLQHLDHISGRSNVWYVGHGHLHTYRFAWWRAIVDGWVRIHTEFTDMQDADGGMEVSRPSGSATSIAFYAAETAQAAEGTEVITRVGAASQEAGMLFFSAATPDPHTNPWAQFHVYRAFLDRSSSQYYVQRRTTSNTTLYNAAWAANANELKMRVQSSTFTAFEGNTQRATQAYGITGSNVHLIAGVAANAVSPADAMSFVFARKFDGVDPTVTVSAPA